MKILHIISGLDVGGAEVVLKRLVLGSTARGNFEHIVVSISGLGQIGRELIDSNITVHTLDARSLLSLPTAGFKLYKLIKRISPDIVQSWMYHADFLSALIVPFCGVKTLYWGIRTTEVRSARFGVTSMLRRICALLSFLSPTKIVCVADAARKSHIEIGYNPKKMVVIHNGFETRPIEHSDNFRSQFRQNHGIEEDATVIGFVGRYNKVKDPQNFIGAAKIILQKHKNIYFTMIGKGCDSNNNELNKIISSSKLNERILLLGMRRDVEKCFKFMDIFCLSSRTEGFPNVLGEAMEAGLPCVTTDVGDAAFLLGDCGSIVAKENSEALANGLTSLILKSKEERAKMGQNSHIRIREYFSLEITISKFEELYSEVKDKNKSKSP